MTTLTTFAPDDPDGTTYTLAPEHRARAIQRRFENRPVVLHPTKSCVYIYDPANFWDGPTHVRWEPDTGHFVFSGWSGEEAFPAIGPLR